MSAAPYLADHSSAARAAGAAGRRRAGALRLRDAGAVSQPVADPGLLGVSSGAALAVACWLVLPLSVPALVALYAPMLAAFIGSIAVMVVIFILSRAEEGSLSRLLLVGSPSTRCAARWWGAGLDKQRYPAAPAVAVGNGQSRPGRMVHAAGGGHLNLPCFAGHLANGFPPQPAAAWR
jgi:hypothetical protein